MDSSRWDVLSDALKDCAQVLEETGDDGRPLRHLQNTSRDMLWVSDNELRTVAFMLDAWISDYFYNFAGDMPSEGSSLVAAIRKDFLQETAAKALSQLAESGGALSKDGFVRLISGYLDALDRANKVV